MFLPYSENPVCGGTFKQPITLHTPPQDIEALGQQNYGVLMLFFMKKLVRRDGKMDGAQYRAIFEQNMLKLPKSLEYGESSVTLYIQLTPNPYTKACSWG